MKKIVYNKYHWQDSSFLYEVEYICEDNEDYDRVMKIIKENPDEYELVNEYNV